MSVQVDNDGWEGNERKVGESVRIILYYHMNESMNQTYCKSDNQSNSQGNLN